MNSVQAVVPTQQSASYVFNPERFTEITEIFWKLSTEVNQTNVESRSADHKAIVFDEAASVWKRGSPEQHAAARVRMEIDINSYQNRSRSKEVKKAIQAWSFPDSGA